MLFRRKTKTKAEGTIRLDSEGILHLQLSGHQTATSLRTFNNKVRDIIASQRSGGKKVYIIADLTGVFATSSGARQESKEFLDADYDGLAVVGNAYLQPLILFTLRNAVTRGAVRYFHTRSAAMNWLKH